MMSFIPEDDPLFMYPYARLKPFILAAGRKHTGQAILETTGRRGLDSIVRVHTDGFITTGNRMKNTWISDRLGHWKLEHEGTVVIKSNIDIKWS